MSASISTSLSFSPWDMFLHAGPLVRVVMALLVLACLVSWIVFFARMLELGFIHKVLMKDGKVLEEAFSLTQGKEKTTPEGTARLFIMAVENEQEKSRDIPHNDEGIKERTALHLERLEANEGRRLARGTAILATIGATAPFIGLFGTVWGIMTSFTGIAASKTTSLTIVAPGIAEALLATALGLIAAIPAVMIYNHLLRKTILCRALLADLTTQVMRLASRDMDRRKVMMKAPTDPINSATIYGEKIGEKLMAFPFAPRLAGE